MLFIFNWVITKNIEIIIKGKQKVKLKMKDFTRPSVDWEVAGSRKVYFNRPIVVRQMKGVGVVPANGIKELYLF